MFRLKVRRRSRSFAALFGTLTLLCGASQFRAQTTVWHTSMPLPPGLATAASSAAAGDVIGDGHPEAIVATQAVNGTAQIRIADLYAAGGPLTIVLTHGGSVRDLAAKDIDGDGDLDIVAAGAPTELAEPNAITVFRNSAGSFNSLPPVTTIMATTTHRRMTFRDDNADGLVDIFIGRTILHSNGSGGFFYGPIVTGAPLADRLVPGDLDGDGDLDLVAGYQGTVSGTLGYVLRAFRKSAGGAYTGLTAHMTLPGATFGAVLACDVDADGKDDVVVRAAQLAAPSRLSVYRSGAGAALSLHSSIDRFGQHHHRAGLLVADFDADGDPDIVEAFDPPNADVTFPVLLTNDGTGALGPTRGPCLAGFGQNLPARSLPLADFDLDGRIDALCADQNVWARNRTGEPGAPAIVPTVAPSSLPASGIIVTPNTTYINFNASLPSIMVGSAPLGAEGAWINVRVLPGPVPATSNTGTEWFVASGSVITTNTSFDLAEAKGPVTIEIRPFGETFGATVALQAIRPLEPISGEGQTVSPDQTAAMPLIIEARSSNGSPEYSADVSFTSVGAVPLTFLEADPIHANQNGRVLVHVAAGSLPGSGRVRASALVSGILRTVDVDFTVAPGPIVTVLSGGPAGAGILEPFPAPMSVRVTDALGAPLAGVAVDFRADALAGDGPVASPSTVLTDAGGLATTTWTAGSGSRVFFGTATTAAGGAATTFAIRRLQNIAFPFGNTFLVFNCESPGVPLIVAVDTPLAAPGYIANPFGRLYTSILSPSATLLAADGIGIGLGTYTPSLITNNAATWGLSFANPIPPIGYPLVVQVYGYNAFRPYPQSLIVSNPITLNL